MTDMALWSKMNEVYRKYFAKDPPARTAVGVTALPLPGALLEMECVAEVRT